MEGLIEEFFNNPEQFAVEIVKKLREEIESGKEGRTAADDLVHKLRGFVSHFLFELSRQTQKALKESIGYVPEELHSLFGLIHSDVTADFLTYTLLNTGLLSALAVANERKSRPELSPLLQEFRSLKEERLKASARPSGPSVNVFFLCCCPSKKEYQLTLEDGTKIPLPDGRIIRKAITGGNER